MRQTLLLWLVALAVAVPACGRSHVSERELERLATEYTRNTVERRLDEAAAMLTGEARQAAMLAFPMLKAVDVKQKLVEVESRAEPVTGSRDRGAVKVTYRVQTEVPGYGSSTERIQALYEFIRQKSGGWRIYRMAILDQEQEAEQ